MRFRIIIWLLSEIPRQKGIIAMISPGLFLESNIGVYVARRGVSGSIFAYINAKYSEEVSLAAASANRISYEFSEFDSGFGDWIAVMLQTFLSTVTGSFFNVLKVENGDGTGAYIKQTVATVDATD